MKKRQEDEAGRYSLWDNYRYALNRLKVLEGRSAFLFCGTDILVEIIYPFLAMALPSAVVALLASNADTQTILAGVIGYVVLLQLMRLLKENLWQLSYKTLFMFRGKMTMEYFEKGIRADGQFMESTSGQKKMYEAMKNVYSGNVKGVEAFVRAFNNAAINFGGMIVYGVIIGQKSLLLLGFLAILTFIAAYGNYLAGERGYGIEKAYLKEWRNFQYLKDESLKVANGKDIRLYKMKDWFVNTFYDTRKKMVSLQGKMQDGYVAAGILEKSLSFLRDILIYAYFIYEMVQGNMELSLFLLYVGAVTGFGSWMENFFKAIQEILQNNRMMDAYRDYMDSGVVSYDNKQKVSNGGKVHELRLENVSYRYDGETEDTIKNLNLTIHPGEKLALVGMNGAGKTTLVKLICGFYHPTSGKIYMDGVDISTLHQKEYFKEFAVVFQDVFTFSFSLEDNVTCGPEEVVEKNKLEECLKKSDLWEKVCELEYGVKTMMNKDLDEKGVTLSGGELQKLMLARALYKEAPIVILDEPTAALDPIAESNMYEKYYDLTKDKTSIFISHRLSSTRFCDRILFMENGIVTEQGSHEELMQKNGAYANMFEVQAHYYQKKQQEEELYA